jgi:hypothetical protein
MATQSYVIRQWTLNTHLPKPAILLIDFWSISKEMSICCVEGQSVEKYQYHRQEKNMFCLDDWFGLSVSSFGGKTCPPPVEFSQKNQVRLKRLNIRTRNKKYRVPPIFATTAKDEREEDDDDSIFSATIIYPGVLLNSSREYPSSATNSHRCKLQELALLRASCICQRKG